MQQQFEANLERAEVLNLVATTLREADAEQPAHGTAAGGPARPELAANLLDLLTNARAILEIAVVDPDTNEILADSDPARIGEKSGPYPDFRGTGR